MDKILKEEKELISHCIMYKDTRVVAGAKTLRQDPSVFDGAADCRAQQCA